MPEISVINASTKRGDFFTVLAPDGIGVTVLVEDAIMAPIYGNFLRGLMCESRDLEAEGFRGFFKRWAIGLTSDFRTLGDEDPVAKLKEIALKIYLEYTEAENENATI